MVGWPPPSAASPPCSPTRASPLPPRTPASRAWRKASPAPATRRPPPSRPASRSPRNCPPATSARTRKPRCCAPAGAQQRGFRVRADVAGGQFRGDRLAGRDGSGRRVAGAGDAFLQARDAGVLGGRGEARVGEQGGEAALGGGHPTI